MTVHARLNEHHEPTFASTSITQRVPTLVHDGFSLSESSAICEYVGANMPEMSAAARACADKLFFAANALLGDRSDKKEVALVPADWEVATLSGFDLNLAPRANLVRNPGATVYGILATATHAELERLYTGHSKAALGESYLPEAVLGVDKAGKFRPALSYIAPEMIARPAEKAYVKRIALPAERFGFPRAYVERIRSFAR